MASQEIAHAAVNLAEALLHDAQQQQTPQEFEQARRIARMMGDPRGKALTIALADQVFRSRQPARIANQLRYLLRTYGTPRYMERWEQTALALGGLLGRYAADLIVPPFTARLRQETSSVILPGEEEALRQYLHERRQASIRLNLNYLGEAILGEDEAHRRLDAYLGLLARDDVEYISIKLSSICSQINLVAFAHTVELVQERLRELYRAAMQHTYQHADGRVTAKFINLDMEEYRDLHLTVAAFCNVLDEPEFLQLSAGIVLQAYLPDAFPMQQHLTSWARTRCQRGGAPIKLRIVKGANLAMEYIEASLCGWIPAPYSSKLEVDANFKRMVAYGCQADYATSVHLGIASHNLFDIAYALVLRAIHQVEEYVDFEMLEGMANHQARVVQAYADRLLLYAPVVKMEDFHSAIAYLVRRLDENTAEQNFLHDLFGMEPGSSTWDKQRTRFLVAVELMDRVSTTPRRSQNRHTEQVHMLPESPFFNIPDTDWSLSANQSWLRDIVQCWHTRDPEVIPLQVGGELIRQGTLANGEDPSRPGFVPYRYVLATLPMIEQALDEANQAQAEWAATPVATRRDYLIRVAEELARERGNLIGAMMLDAAKTVLEADSEVSEAIDFANYYARAFDTQDIELSDCQARPLGTVIITPPWNFPCAIPAGGVLAALMAGNSVILKPAPETVMVAWQIVQAFWRAGIPHTVLQFLACPDNEVGQALVTDARADAVILTGARSTALMFLDWKPDMRLFAETSGKNSMIITAMADRDQAIKDLVRSAFGHNGQKCSAASLAICEAEVYDDPAFRRQLRDAAASLPVGSAWDLVSKITPLTQLLGINLARALTCLETGEEWLLEPRIIDGSQLWSPGIKLGVQPGSFFHQTECFGPVLGLMRADNLQHAVALANATLYGLTGGLHSLDEREHAYWQQSIQVGNAYINRHITGAIVQRQPFGGWKGSVFGPGAKAGGPNYVFQLQHWEQVTLPQQQTSCAAPVTTLLERCLELLPPAYHELLQASARSYAYAWQYHFNRQHDPTAIPGEANWLRYRGCTAILTRITQPDDLVAICQVALAARTCGVPLTISLPPTIPGEWVYLAERQAIQVMIEDEAQLISRLQMSRDYERLRVPAGLSLMLRRVAQASALAVIDTPVLANGRLELRAYLREQALSYSYHRYGNVIRLQI